MRPGCPRGVRRPGVRASALSVSESEVHPSTLGDLGLLGPRGSERLRVPDPGGGGI